MHHQPPLQETRMNDTHSLISSFAAACELWLAALAEVF